VSYVGMLTPSLRAPVVVKKRTVTPAKKPVAVAGKKPVVVAVKKPVVVVTRTPAVAPSPVAPSPVAPSPVRTAPVRTAPAATVIRVPTRDSIMTPYVVPTPTRIVTSTAPDAPIVRATVSPEGTVTVRPTAPSPASSAPSSAPSVPKAPTIEVDDGDVEAPRVEANGSSSSLWIAGLALVGGVAFFALRGGK